MENLTKLSWLILTLIHVLPAFVFFWPDMVQRLYGVSPQGEMGVLLIHRGGLFLAVCVAAILAIFIHDMRRLASIVVAISVLSFLLVYVRAGVPTGSLRKIAFVDVAALLPLAYVSWVSWQGDQV